MLDTCNCKLTQSNNVWPHQHWGNATCGEKWGREVEWSRELSLIKLSWCTTQSHPTKCCICQFKACITIKSLENTKELHPNVLLCVLASRQTFGIFLHSMGLQSCWDGFECTTIKDRMAYRELFQCLDQSRDGLLLFVTMCSNFYHSISIMKLLTDEHTKTHWNDA